MKRKYRVGRKSAAPSAARLHSLLVPLPANPEPGPPNPSDIAPSRHSDAGLNTATRTPVPPNHALGIGMRIVHMGCIIIFVADCVFSKTMLPNAMLALDPSVRASGIL